MKATDILTALIHFFNDLIAHIIPGMIAGISAAFLFDQFDSDGFQRIHWSIHIATYYVIGHLLLAIHSKVHFLIPLGFNKFDSNLVSSSTIIKEFKKIIPNKGNKLDIESLAFHDLRSIAMSIDREACDLGRRFMFISLFCKGMAASMLVNSFLLLYIVIIDFTCSIETVCQSIYLLLAVLAAYTFNTRSAEFERRALISPFSVAICKLLLLDAERQTDV